MWALGELVHILAERLLEHKQVAVVHRHISAVESVVKPVVETPVSLELSVVVFELPARVVRNMVERATEAPEGRSKYEPMHPPFL